MLLRQTPAPSGSDFLNQLRVFRERSAPLHAAIRDWVESLLPQSRQALDAEFSFFNARLQADLQGSKLTDPSAEGPDVPPGIVNRIELSRPLEDGNKLTVIAGIAVPCGTDDAAYIYDYSQGRPRRVLESHGTRDHDESLSDVRFSSRDVTGNQLILTLRYAVQCGSTWNMLSYDLFRMSATANASNSILRGQHEIWFSIPYQLRLESNELLMEFRGSSIDDGMHNRAHVLHLQASDTKAERIDPVALQPQDFVDEWLTRPWSEMESRSAEDGRDKLKRWHEFLADGFVAGEFQFVQQCQEGTGRWQVGVDLGWISGKELPEGLRVYFSVQQSEQYRFAMTGIRFDRDDECPGESLPNSTIPTLFSASQKASR